MFRTWPLSKRFALLSGPVLVGAGVLIGVVNHSWFLESIEGAAERNNVALARVLSNVVWPKFEADVLTRDFSAWRTDLNREIASLIRHSSVVKVKLYRADGSVAYSTDPTASYPSDFAAATTAAAEVLAYVFPDRADVIRGKAEEAMRSRQLAGLEFPSDVAAGREIGTRIAALAIERGKIDGSDRKWTGTVPEGPGKWNGTNPINPAAATWKTWVLAAPDALRPPAPPAWDSPQMKAELEELKAFESTPKTNSVAMYWETFGGRAVTRCGMSMHAGWFWNTGWPPIRRWRRAPWQS